MGFVKSMLSADKGAGFTAQQDPNAIDHLEQQYATIHGLEGQLSNVAQGQGPNPALAQLQQTTDENIAKNAGFVASQKGINPAMAARMAGQNAGHMNQMAAGQAGVQTANQQLAAMGQLGSLAGNTQANIQTGINSANTGNAQIATANTQGQYGLMNSLGKVGALPFAQGGMVHKYADGGSVMSGPQSALGQFFAGNNSLNGNAGLYIGQNAVAPQPQEKGGPPKVPGMVDPTAGASAMGSAGAADLSGAGAAGAGGAAAGGATAADMAPLILLAANGGMANLREGGRVLGGKAKVKGDSLKNDTVPAVLSPKEIVLPRSVTMAPDAPKRAAEFVARVLAKNGLRKK